MVRASAEVSPFTDQSTSPLFLPCGVTTYLSGFARLCIMSIPTTLTDFLLDQAWVLEMINAILIEVLGAIAENE